MIAPRLLPSQKKFMKAGILGGGQLGRMLLQAAANYTVETFVLENDAHCPAAHLCHHFTQGDIRDFETVYHFGKGLDVLTIEIESVNIEALEKLAAEGVRVIPHPSAIRIFRNKILQKEFYQQNEIPTSPFYITHSIDDVKQYSSFLPAVHKVAEGGYDGRGVQVLEDTAAIEKAFPTPAVLEKKVAIQKEIALIIAAQADGSFTIFPPAEMIFDPQLNLLDYQLSPARIPTQLLWKAEAIVQKIVKALQSPGLFAVELFIDTNEQVWVNETAPRVHNSGHHTIEANYCSQYDMLWRIMLGYPLGNTAPIMPSAIINIIGAAGYAGEAHYEGLDEVLKMENVFVHLYGKKDTKPGRKMGHATILGNDYPELSFRANKIKQTLKVKTQSALESK